MENLSVEDTEAPEYFDHFEAINLSSEGRDFYVVYRGRQTGIFDNW